MKKAVKRAVIGAVGEVLGPRPCLAILSFWQGVVEIILRITVTVTAVGILVAGGVALGQLKEAMQEELPSNKGAWSPASGMVAAGFLVGVAAVAFVADATAILFRFINIGYCNLKIRTLLVVDIVVSALLLMGVMASSIPAITLAAVSFNNRGGSGGSTSHRAEVSLAVAGALGLSMAAMLALLVLWMILFLVFGWNKKVLDYTLKHM